MGQGAVLLEGWECKRLGLRTRSAAAVVVEGVHALLRLYDRYAGGGAVRGNGEG
jgi:hypothetical protein